MTKEKSRKIDFCIELVITRVILLLIDKYVLDLTTATLLFYSSETYKILLDKKSHLWAESPWYTLETLEDELFSKKFEYATWVKIGTEVAVNESERKEVSIIEKR